MRKITEETPVEECVVQGLTLHVYVPFALGDVLETEGEVSAMCQTFKENVRNTFAAKIKKLLDELKEDEELDVEAIDEKFLAYQREYEFGIRRASLPSDPVEAEAIRIAIKVIEEKIKRANQKVSNYERATIRQMAETLVAENPQLREIASKQIEARESVVSSVGLDI